MTLLLITNQKKSLQKTELLYYITKAGLKDGSKPETGNVVEGKTDVTYVYEKAGSVIVNYQTEDGTELKAPYTDTPETVAEVVTEKYYVDADGQEVVVEDKTVRTPKKRSVQH